jgi:hypothetical protein
MRVYYRDEISRFGEGQTMVAALKMAGGTSPEGKLAGLKATRTELLGRVAQLTAARQRLDAAADGERVATAAIGELDAAPR